ncbi:MAG: hypothetical protein ACI8P2_003810 [Candidatus Latescibacterota bacterium]|jgi:hypothetical protein
MENENWIERAEHIIAGKDSESLGLDFEALRDEFAHVFWIGGSGCAGKSTVANILAEKYDLTTYHTDDRWKDHFQRVETEQLPLPTITRIIARRNTGEKREDQADIAHDKYMAICFAIWQEAFTLELDYLRSLPSNPIIVEGVFIVPWLVAKIAPQQRVAILVSYDDFRRENYMNPNRPEAVLNRFKNSYDPEIAVQNIIAANLPMAQTLFKCAKKNALLAMEIDGKDDPDTVAKSVAVHFRL